MGNPLDADLGRRQPAVTIAQPDEEVGARSLEPNGVEPALVELRQREREACRDARAKRPQGRARRGGSRSPLPARGARRLAPRRRRSPSPRSGSRRSSTGSNAGSPRPGASGSRACARVRWARRWSVSARSSGSDSPVIVIVAPRVSIRWSTSASDQGGLQSSESSGACWTRARRTCMSRNWGST